MNSSKNNDFFIISVKNILQYKEPYFTIKLFLCNGKISWVLKVLNGTSDANKEPSVN